MKKKKESSTLTHYPESLLDEAGNESFPASDPLAWNLGTSHLPIEKSKNQIAHLLINEHQLIKKVINVITILIKDLSSQHTINTKALKELSHFFQHFVEQTHHKKEALLYELLNQQDNKNKMSAYVLKDLSHEHRFGEELLKKLHDLSLSIPESNIDANNSEKMIRLLKDMHHFYLTHIQKEEEYILPHIHQILNEEMQKKLLSQFEKINPPFNLEKYKLLLELTNETV